MNRLLRTGSRQVTTSEERIRNPNTSELLTVLKILRKEHLAFRLHGSRDDQRVVPRQRILRVELQCLCIECLGRVHAQQGAENRSKVLQCIGRSHRVSEPIQSHVEKLLDHLITDDALLGRQSLANQLGGFPGFRGGSTVEYTKIFESRKNLSLIHFISAEGSTCVHLPHLLHERIETLGIPRAFRELYEPLTECRIQCSALRTGDGAGTLNQVLIGTQCDVFVFLRNIVEERRIVRAGSPFWPRAKRPATERVAGLLNC